MLALSLTTDSFTATLLPLLLPQRKFMETSWECSPDNPRTGPWRVQITEQTVASDDRKQAAPSHVVIWHSTQQMFSNISKYNSYQALGSMSFHQKGHNCLVSIGPGRKQPSTQTLSPDCLVSPININLLSL